MARATKGEGHQMMRDTPLVTDMPRDKYVERCKQRALDYLDRGDIEKAVTLDHHHYGRPHRLQNTKLFGNAWRFAADGERCARAQIAD
jgi:hypothetical protein